ncbi:SH3 domain-containing protein, partial [Helicobacter vulpis]|uniref:SH3 domain-containing protein n=1 Tax=Helicobacter vulpis TaxID=2316076 RepID=UPI0013CE1812
PPPQAQPTPPQASTPPSPPPPQKPTEPPKPKMDVYYVAVDVLNVRALPSTHARVTQRLTRGQEVSIQEVKKGWGKIESGWVFLDFLRPKTPLQP